MRRDPHTYPWERRLGATPAGDGLTTFRVWAPGAETVAVRVNGEDHALAGVGEGIREATVPAGHGDDYGFVLDGGDPLPDPCSRWQPQGLRGPSRVVDHTEFAWTDHGYAGVPLAGMVIYELHIGTFTPAGTFDAAAEDLQRLKDLGVTAIEVMPVAEFPGARGWGYDGVYISAAQSSYGGPEGFQRLVDAAHAHGIAVILDVVYNHLGASGVQAIEAYGPYFTEKYETFWGKALNYDDEHCDPVREWVLQSAEGWVRDFHVDGLRLDAIHAIYDQSANPLLRTIAERVKQADPRAVIIAESGMNDPKVIRPAGEGGYGHDAQWADDFHHALRVLITNDTEGWLEEFGRVEDLAKCFRRPFFHDGQFSSFRRKRFGAPADDRPVEQFVVFSANHDQVGNRALGDRLPAQAKRLAAFATLLAPFVPMLWMGDEYGEPAPFQFFSDHIDEEIAVATREGRRREFAAFAQFAGEEVPDPQAESTFVNSKLTRTEDPVISQLHADLLRERRHLGAHEAQTRPDEDARTLHVRRGDHELAMNFAAEERRVAVEGARLVLATHDEARLDDGHVVLPPLAGALVR
ncbi:MAG TPA: malto-oligosyltrehalose trehalohydrolase [Solirubrobacteraceae bacterium]